MSKPQSRDPLVLLADSLMNRALVCDKKGKRELATAHLDVAMQVMLEQHRNPMPAEEIEVMPDPWGLS